MKTKKIIAGLLIVFIAVSLYWFPQFKNDLVQIDNQESVVDSIVSLKGYRSVNVVKEKSIMIIMRFFIIEQILI